MKIDVYNLMNELDRIAESLHHDEVSTDYNLDCNWTAGGMFSWCGPSTGNRLTNDGNYATILYSGYSIVILLDDVIEDAVDAMHKKGFTIVWDEIGDNILSYTNK